MNDIQNLTVKLQITVMFLGISMKVYRTESVLGQIKAVTLRFI